METLSLRNVFINNRAEQLPLDVWDEYVVPVHFAKIDIRRDRKSVLIQGGRGCGKTMFIRYYCHSTVFSPNRRNIPESELESIGLYWKPDVKFCSFLEKPGWIPEEYKERAFQHLVALSVLEDFYQSLCSLSNADLSHGQLDPLSIELRDDIALYFGRQVKTYRDMGRYIDAEHTKLDLWVKNPEQDKPTFLQFDGILEKIAEQLSYEDERLRNIFFRVFVDEYENLESNQQKLLNDHIKHPGKRFSLNIATRRHSRFASESSGFERVVETHDYRKVDLEQEFLDVSSRSSFSILAAEILLLRLQRAGYSFPDAPDLGALQDASRIEERKSAKYQDGIRKVARQIFPQMSSSEIAEHVLADHSLNNRLRKLIIKGLKKHQLESKIKPEDFIHDLAPEATIVTACLLNRDTTKPQKILNELQRAAVGEESSFSKNEWIQTNLYGAIFYLYSGLPKRACLLYSGFDRFCQIARSNLRFFQELCHEALIIYEFANGTPATTGEIFEVSPAVQAQAAKITSEKLLVGVADFGWELFHLIRRLGKLFQISHKRPSQSEPEVNHFSISGRLDREDQIRIDDLLNNARVWSILYEEKDTKNKSAADLESSDYFPNPIFTPYFGISYRKKRKLTITAADFLSILEGNDDRFEKIRVKYERKWGLNNSDSIDSVDQKELDF